MYSYSPLLRLSKFSQAAAKCKGFFFLLKVLTGFFDGTCIRCLLGFPFPSLCLSSCLSTHIGTSLHFPELAMLLIELRRFRVLLLHHLLFL